MGRLTLPKLLFTCVLGFLPALLVRRFCVTAAGSEYWLTLNLRQFAPLIDSVATQAPRAVQVLAALSRPMERLLDIGYAFMAVALVYAVVRRRPGSGPDAPSRLGTVMVSAYVGVYAVQQVWMLADAPVVCDGPRFRMDAAVLARDIVDAAVYVYLSIAAYRHHAPVKGPSRASRLFCVAAAVVQLSGMAFRYTGVVAAPSAAFGLFLGAAYLVSPLQLFLAAVLCYTLPHRPRGRVVAAPMAS